jgi:6-pyruvoyltetrahydropterin/6-carboxytetrahydropterin synthase
MTHISITRYHDFSAGHRVYNQGGHCEKLHGHNYRVYFTCTANKLNDVGMVIDFSIIKTLLCDWLEINWDHKMIIWENDPWAKPLQQIDPTVALVPFNPTAENLAEYILTVVGPSQLKDTGVTLEKVTFEETRKCSATFEL